MRVALWPQAAAHGQSRRAAAENETEMKHDDPVGEEIHEEEANMYREHVVSQACPHPLPRPPSASALTPSRPLPQHATDEGILQPAEFTSASIRYHQCVVVVVVVVLWGSRLPGVDC